MDPALCELYESGASDDEVAVILRLNGGAKVPEGARVVSQFGESILTARIRRGEIPRVWELTDPLVCLLHSAHSSFHADPARLLRAHGTAKDAAKEGDG